MGRCGFVVGPTDDRVAAAATLRPAWDWSVTTQATELTPAIDVSCPLPDDLNALLREHMGGPLEDASEALRAEAGLNFGVGD